MSDLDIQEQIVLVNQKLREINDDYKKNLFELKYVYLDWKRNKDDSLKLTKENDYKDNIDKINTNLEDLRNLRTEYSNLFAIKNTDIDSKISEINNIREFWKTSGELRTKNERKYLASQELKEVNYSRKLDTYSVSIFLLFSIATMGVVIKKIIKMP